MLRDNPDYRRLLPSRLPFARVSFWLGSDHLLLAEITGMQESYRRFGLRDLRAVVIRPTRRRLILSFLILAVAALLFAISSAISAEILGADGSSLTTIIGGVILVLFGVLPLALNINRGPGCQVTLCTQVQNIVVPGLTRRPAAERLLFEMTPIILAAQAEVGQSAPANYAPGPQT